MVALADLPLLVTPKQAAEVMGPTESQVRGLIRDRRLAHVMVGSRLMIPREAIEQFIASNTVIPCREETQDRGYIGTGAGTAGTSPIPSAAAAGSAQRALQIARSLKS